MVAVDPLMAWALLPLKVTVPVPGRKLPLLSQLPRTETGRLLLRRLPPRMLRLPRTVRPLVTREASGLLVAFTVKWWSGAKELTRMTCAAGVLASPICNVPPVTVLLVEEMMTSAVAFEQGRRMTMLPPEKVNGAPALSSKAALVVLVLPIVQRVTVPPDWV